MRTWLPLLALVVLMALVIGANAACPTPGQCGKWVVTYHPPETDYLNDPSFDALMNEGATGDEAALKGDREQEASGDDSKTDRSKQEKAQKGPGVDLSGRWLFDLDGVKETINLILIPAGDRIQGYGTMVVEGEDTPAAAIGSISEDGLSLDVKPTKGERTIQCKMTLNPDSDSNTSLLGGYELYKEGQLLEKGNATGRKPRVQ